MENQHTEKKNVWALVGLVAVVLLIAAAVNNGSTDSQLAAGGKPAPVVYCNETDGGLNYSMMGTVKNYTIDRKGNQVVKSSASDSCSGSNSVTEYVCMGSTGPYKTYQGSCGTGSCVNGACVPGNNISNDTTAPVATMLAPTNGTTVCQYTMTATANDGVYTIDPSGVTFYLNGSMVPQATVFYPGGGSYPDAYGTTTYVTNNIIGANTAYVRACDASGNCANSTPITFTVTNQCTS